MKGALGAHYTTRSWVQTTNLIKVNLPPIANNDQLDQNLCACHNITCGCHVQNWDSKWIFYFLISVKYNFDKF